MAFQFYLDVQIPNQNEEFYLWVDTWKDFYDNVSSLHLIIFALISIAGVFTELTQFDGCAT
jgi:hypothetical protein